MACETFKLNLCANNQLWMFVSFLLSMMTINYMTSISKTS